MRTAALVSDLFFKGRIAEIARQTGKDVQFFNNIFGIKDADLILLDLNKFGSEAVFRLREKNPEAKIVGYLSHADVELREAAKREGCFFVLSKSEFTKKLPEILGGARIA
ncbi:MAG: response regulator [Candidatus Aenigmarchaeota archaeon]|nr:response regulator [Candidatus Aenigmarchaeota archaeon]